MMTHFRQSAMMIPSLKLFSSDCESLQVSLISHDKW